ncbi:uncharacterized protein EV154DRAFT_513843 [Mucor mucedo]|uniref:uncharacterized protein n=1 Tax=Mucor mucedo TaxID=29922 RepID=UPI002220709F|nr:uncharacterized protein EV154DRAFT_513843 [Mucor mucedo]KAI7889716.1 hypothetical protein EV154DRAFT_513843 [Mucor mucedo]
MNFNIDKIREEEEYDSNVESSTIAPWELSSPFIHHEQQANTLKSKKMYRYNSTNDINQSSDEEYDTHQPKIVHMKKQQQKQKQGDVTRQSSSIGLIKGDDYNRGSKSKASAAAAAASAAAQRSPPAAAAAAAATAAGLVAGIKPIVGDDYDQNFFFDTGLSPSSSIMYQHPNSISPSPSSSKMMLLENDSNINHMIGRESILMKQALKSTIATNKRRESIEVMATNTTRKRPVSTSIIPRLTKSSIISTQQKPQLHKRTNSTSTARKRHLSLQQPISQKDRNYLASIISEQDDYLHGQDISAGVHWDPHIDAFEILRAKITGITRSMQEFHVQELFHDEKRKKKKLTATTSSPLITTSRNNISNNRRLSLVTSHRRIRSQSCVPLSLPHDNDEKTECHNYDDNDEEEEEEEEEDQDVRTMASPNLTALFLTTNNLIHSRLDELSETASIKSAHDDINEVTSILEWQKKFLSLVTSCIHQSEELESLSTDVLNTEHRVRELMLINETIHEQFNEREKQYEERIRECQDVAQQQLMMLDSLEELTADINMKTESRRRESHRQEALLALDANYYNHHNEDINLLDDDHSNNRWNFQRSVADLLNMDDKYDLIQKMRWDIGMFVGGGVGTGHVIHSYEDKLNGIDMMIAGTGTTTTAINNTQYYQEEEDEYDTDDEYTHQTESFSISPSIGHIKLYQHQYVLHLNSKDRRTRFALLPKCLWIPDNETNQCQFQLHNRRRRCQIEFTFFQRKHHCRRCGYIMCQKHSANRLPLFSSSKIHSTTGQWSRVCDNCFHDLIVQK